MDFSSDWPCGHRHDIPRHRTDAAHPAFAGLHQRQMQARYPGHERLPVPRSLFHGRTSSCPAIPIRRIAASQNRHAQSRPPRCRSRQRVNDVEDGNSRCLSDLNGVPIRTRTILGRPCTATMSRLASRDACGLATHFVCSFGALLNACVRFSRFLVSETAVQAVSQPSAGIARPGRSTHRGNLLSPGDHSTDLTGTQAFTVQHATCAANRMNLQSGNEARTSGMRFQTDRLTH